MTTKKEPKGIQSINIGFSILSILMASGNPMPLKELSRRSGFSPSKVHSYLVSFTNLEMVSQDPETGMYSLGPFALKLGMGYLDQVDLFSMAKPLMQKLAFELGHTIFLGVWGNRGPTIVFRIDGPESLAIFDLRIGSVLPLLNSALGLNFASHMSASTVESFIKHELKIGGAHGFSNMKAVQETLGEIRIRGISRSRGQLLSDFTALSVPVFDFSGSILAGLTVMGRIGVLDDDYDGKSARILKETGCQFSIARGYKK